MAMNMHMVELLPLLEYPSTLIVLVVRVTDESISRYAGTILLRMLRKIDHIW